ncbi:hypothetical protein MUK42_15047 [Musa troglodytarum]|uniref:Uncharacterized protein n=1 Tax=Musa troglodytarum TaxID=320322 RepID=A0A9E7IIV1_9LILI|nr:hypothetical protein MUK42_15047 [Musa troglodytarum]
MPILEAAGGRVALHEDKILSWVAKDDLPMISPWSSVLQSKPWFHYSFIFTTASHTFILESKESRVDFRDDS